MKSAMTQGRDMQLGLRVMTMAGLLMLTGCAGNSDAPPPDAAAAPPPAPLSEADREKVALEKMPLQLTSPLSPSFVPVLVRQQAGAPAPEALPAVASQTLCAKAVKAKAGKDTSVHPYCIEAYKDGRRVLHPVS